MKCIYSFIQHIILSLLFILSRQYEQTEIEICFVSTNLNVERYHPSFYVHLLKIIGSPSSLLFLHKICTRFILCKDLGRQNSSFPKTTFPDFGQLEYSHNLDAFPLHLRVFCAFAQIIGSPLHLLSFLQDICTIFTFGQN